MGDDSAREALLAAIGRYVDAVIAAERTTARSAVGDAMNVTSRHVDMLRAIDAHESAAVERGRREAGNARD